MIRAMRRCFELRTRRESSTAEGWADQVVGLRPPECLHGRQRDRGTRGIVVRCDPSIDHLGVVYEDGTESDMVACGEVDGLRFGVLLVAPETQSARWPEPTTTEQSSTVSTSAATIRRARDPPGLAENRRDRKIRDLADGSSIPTSSLQRSAS